MCKMYPADTKTVSTATVRVACMLARVCVCVRQSECMCILRLAWCVCVWEQKQFFIVSYVSSELELCDYVLFHLETVFNCAYWGNNEATWNLKLFHMYASMCVPLLHWRVRKYVHVFVMHVH